MRHLPPALLGTMALAACAPSQTTYAWQQIPTKVNITNLALPQLDINQTNQVVGQTSGHQAFIWSGGAVQTLGTFGGPSSTAYGINDFGVAVGSADVTATTYHPFKSSGGPLVDQGTLNGGAYADGRDINFYGDFVGQAIDGTTHQRQAYIGLGLGGPIMGLGTLAGSNSLYASAAYGINNNDEVVGFSTRADFTSHAFSWTNGGGMVDLGTLGGSFSTATRVNDNGDVVGYSTLVGDSTTEAFLISGGMMNPIAGPSGSTSIGIDLNLSDQVVGLYTTPSQATRAFIYEGGTSYDLTSLLIGALPGGASVAEAYAINDNGAIAAVGTDGFAYLLTPQAVPEPGTYGLMCGIAMLAVMRRRNPS